MIALLLAVPGSIVTLQQATARSLEALVWIVGSGLAMSAVALLGALAIVLPRRVLDRTLLPMVGFAAGSLLGGALFHLLPEAVDGFDNALPVFLWVLLGFTAFFALEQFLHWHQSHTTATERRQPGGDRGSQEEHGRRPEAYLILLGDGLHNLLGGLSVGAAFIVDIGLGVAAWIAAAAHEVPQEVGDFAILLHGGFPKRRALLLNFASALTFPVGGLAAWAMAARIDVLFLLPFAAGNFLYIGASDLIPEIKAYHGLMKGVVHLGCFLLGAGMLWVLAVVLG